MVVTVIHPSLSVMPDVEKQQGPHLTRTRAAVRHRPCIYLHKYLPTFIVLRNPEPAETVRRARDCAKFHGSATKPNRAKPNQASRNETERNGTERNGTKPSQD